MAAVNQAANLANAIRIRTYSATCKTTASTMNMVRLNRSRRIPFFFFG